MGLSNFSLPESIALVGYGYWGKKLYRYVKENPRFKLAKVYFPSLRNHHPSDIRRTWGPEFTSDLDDIWQDREIPNVVVATPISTHYEVVRSALLNGKNVLVEKPLALDGQQAQEMARLASDRNLVMETEYTYTYSKALQQAQTLVKEGLIGTLRSVCVSFQQLGRFLEYDVFLLLGSHALSILDCFVPLEELSIEAFPLMEVDHRTTSALIEFTSKANSGCAGYLAIDLHCPKKNNRVMLCGDRGTILYDPNLKHSLTLTTFNPRPKQSAVDVQGEKSFSFDETHNLRYAMDHFYDVLKHKKTANQKRAVLINTVLDSLREKMFRS